MEDRIDMYYANCEMTKQNELISRLQKEQGETVVIGGKTYKVVAFPMSFFDATRRVTEKFFAEFDDEQVIRANDEKND